MKTIVIFVAVCAAAIAAEPKSAGRWETQYFYDENGSQLIISDLKFPSAKRGIAAGYILKKDKPSPTVVLTSDGGAHWTLVPVKEEPYSLFFLDDSLGWMVTDKGLWETNEAGRTWKKIPNFPKDLSRVYFVDRKHGWAIGNKMQVLETSDGAATWRPIPAIDELKVAPEFTTFGWVAFSNAKNGIIAGWNIPPMRNSVPDWADPEKAQNRRLRPSTLVLLQTMDGGASWQPSTASIFGRVTRVSLTSGGDSLGLVEFNNTFEWPSEVYRFHAGRGDSSRLYRKADRLITDILLTESGAAYLAGTEVAALVHDSPIPGKLKIVHATTEGGQDKFEEMPVDYRATAHRAFIAAAPSAGLDPEVWVATDTGMILKLVTSASAGK